MLLNSKPNPNNKFKPEKEYDSPDEEIDFYKDNTENRRLLGIKYDQQRGSLSVGADSRSCDVCNKVCMDGCYHCFECYDFDLCKDCYSTNIHDHNGINYFHFLKKSNLSSVASIAFENQKSASSVLLKCFEEFDERYFVGQRSSVETLDVHWLRFKDIKLLIFNFIKGLEDILGAQNDSLNKQDYFSLCASNSIDWIVTDFSCVLKGLVSVPIHLSMSYDVKKYILDLTKAKFILCSPGNLEETKKLKKECEFLKYIIVVDYKKSELTFKSSENVYGFSEIIKRGKEIKKEVQSVIIGKKDIVCVSFTSGSSGTPKGVVFENFKWFQSNPMRTFPNVEVLFSSLSYLTPRLLVLANLVNGGRFLMLTNNDLNNLFKDIKDIKVTTLSVPPRILNSVYEEFCLSVETKIKENKKMQDEENCDIEQIKKKIKTEEYHKLVEKQIFGSRVIRISTGGAPVSTKIKRFIRMITGTPVYEGFGSSEAGNIAYNGEKKQNIKLVSVPELGYLTTDKPYPRGEIVIKSDGTNINRYFTDSVERGNSGIDEDGYYHTKDIGELRDGTISVIDRMSNIIKLSQGEFFSLERIELVIESVSYIKEAIVFPNSMKTKLYAIIVVEKSIIEKENQILTDEKIRKDIIHLQNPLKSWEIPVSFIISDSEFTIENKCRTISHKKNRIGVLKKFKSQIEDLNKSNQSTDLNQWISDILNLHEKKNDDSNNSDNLTLIEMGIDSLYGIKLLNLLKSKFGVRSLKYSDLLKLKKQDLFNLCLSPTSQSSLKETKKKEGSIFVSFEEEEPKLLKLLEHEQEKEEKEDKSTLEQRTGVLLTGATGFVGSYILKKLLKQQKESEVYCLVRPTSKEKFLADYKNHKRVHLIESDLSNPFFNDLKELRKNLKLIIHCGAHVNHILSYDDLFDTNVRSCLELMKLSNQVIPIHYVSTISIFSNSQIKYRKHGYSSSKYIADSFLLKYQKNIKVFRLNFIGFSINEIDNEQSKTSKGLKENGFRINERDRLMIFLKTCIKYKIFPSSLKKIDTVPMNMSSVDHIASFIINENLHKDRNCFNFAKKNVSISKIIQFLEKWIIENHLENEYEYFEKYQEFIDKLKKINLKEKNIFFPFVDSWEKNERIGDQLWIENYKKTEECIDTTSSYEYKIFFQLFNFLLCKFKP